MYINYIIKMKDRITESSKMSRLIQSHTIAGKSSCYVNRNKIQQSQFVAISVWKVNLI